MAPNLSHGFPCVSGFGFCFVFYTTGDASAILGYTVQEKLATKLPVAV